MFLSTLSIIFIQKWFSLFTFRIISIVDFFIMLNNSKTYNWVMSIIFLIILNVYDYFNIQTMIKIWNFVAKRNICQSERKHFWLLTCHCWWREQKNIPFTFRTKKSMHKVVNIVDKNYYDVEISSVLGKMCQEFDFLSVLRSFDYKGKYFKVVGIWQIAFS